MSNTADVRNTFGHAFEKYCTSRNILPKRVNGAFEVSDIKSLSECLNAVDCQKSDIDRNLRNIQNKVIANSKIKPPINKTTFINEGTRKRTWQSLGTGKKCRKRAKLQIYLNDTMQTIPTRLSSDLADTMILSKSSEEIFASIQRYIPKEDLSLSVTSHLRPLLDHFRTLHNKFHYYSCLRGMIKRTQEESKAVALDRLTLAHIPTVNKEEIKAFLTIVFRKVVPTELFGNVKNRRRIVHALIDFVSVPAGVGLNLGYYAKSLKIASISWLSPIENEQRRYSVFTDMLLWFFKEFVVKVLHTQVIILTRGERVFVRRWDWHRLYRQFLRKRVEKKVLLNYVHHKGWKPPKIYYKLIPDVQYNAIAMRKTVNKVRPIVSFRYSGTQKRDTLLVHTFLRQLYALHFGTATFPEQWRSVVRDFSGQETYSVSTDVRDAFGSIVLETLYDIIASSAKDLPDTLKLVHVARKSRVFYHEARVSCREYFSDEDMPFPFSSRTLFARVHKIAHIIACKGWLLARIWKYIFCQRVFIGSKIYLIGRGVVQGTMISPIFSDIYYATVMRNSVENALASSRLIRYVDDVVFVSSSEESAERFLKLTKTGIEKYNCYFNNKTFTNLASAPLEQQAFFLDFIGLLIDTRSLQLLPDFLGAKQQYSHFRANSLKNIQFLARKLKDPFCLKLPTITLDSRVNNVAAIKSNLEDAFDHHAKYILDILKKSFTRPLEPAVAERIVNLITTCNKKRMRLIVRLILGGRTSISVEIAENWIRAILKIFLVTYKPVFQYIRSITDVPVITLD